jgi:Ran-binding protein 3
VILIDCPKIAFLFIEPRLLPSIASNKRRTSTKMARPEEELVANGASETNLETGNQQDVIAEASDGDGGERPVREKLKKTSIASLAQYTSSRANAALQSDELPSTTESRAEQPDIANDAGGPTRGRPARKRSFDDLQKGDTQSINAASQMGVTDEKGSHHKRMRSRDISSGEGLVSNGQPPTEYLEYHDEEENDVDARRSPGGPGVLVEPPATTETTPPPTQVRADDNTILSPKKKRSRDQFDKDQDPKDEGSDISGDSIVRSGSEPAENDDQVAQTTSRTATGEPEKKRPRDEELQSEIRKTAQEVCCP